MKLLPSARRAEEAQAARDACAPKDGASMARRKAAREDFYISGIKKPKPTPGT